MLIIQEWKQRKAMISLLNGHLHEQCMYVKFLVSECVMCRLEHESLPGHEVDINAYFTVSQYRKKTVATPFCNV